MVHFRRVYCNVFFLGVGSVGMVSGVSFGWFGLYLGLV